MIDTGMDAPSTYPHCAVCRKQSDGAKSVPVGIDAHLCGTHFDDWLASPEKSDDSRHVLDRLAAFILRRRPEFAACWDAAAEDWSKIVPARQIAPVPTEPGPRWLTRDECISLHQFDPTGYPEDTIKSKLSHPSPGTFQRVWLEDAVLSKIEQGRRAAAEGSR